MNPKLGWIGMVGIWGTMILMPLAEVLPFTSSQLLFLRGISGGILLFPLMFTKRYRLQAIDKALFIVCSSFVIATYALFEAIKAWGSNPSVIMLNLALIVPFVFEFIRTRTINTKELAVLAVAIFGACLALRVFDASLSVTGMLWSVVTLVANGFSLQYSGETKLSETSKTFYMSLFLMLASICLIWFKGDSFHLPEKGLHTTIALTILFSVGSGYLNLASFFLTFKNLPQVKAGVLVLGIIPVTIIASYFILGKTIDMVQTIGIVILLVALGYHAIAIGSKK